MTAEYLDLHHLEALGAYKISDYEYESGWEEYMTGAYYCLECNGAELSFDYSDSHGLYHEVKLLYPSCKSEKVELRYVSELEALLERLRG